MDFENEVLSAKTHTHDGDGASGSGKKNTHDDSSGSGKKMKNYVELLLASESKVRDFAAKQIVYAPPIITLNDMPLIRKGTINIIQGKFGVHKSRLAELFCSMLLAHYKCETDFLRMKKHAINAYTVCYVDTERNLSEEFPSAIQNIRDKAGYVKHDDLPNFRFTSLKPIPREDRLPALKQFIETIRQESDRPLFILLDVLTDCVSSFNNERENLALFDFLGNLCDDHNVTFLTIIHENFGSEKATGHTGSEAYKKASTVFQISLEKDEKGNDTDLIRLKTIKLRFAKKPRPIYLQYDKSVHGLIEASPELRKEVLGKEAVHIESLAHKIEELLESGMMPKDQFYKAIEAEFDMKERTLDNKLDELYKITYYSNGKECNLVKVHDKTARNKSYFQLVPKQLEPDPEVS